MGTEHLDPINAYRKEALDNILPRWEKNEREAYRPFVEDLLDRVLPRFLQREAMGQPLHTLSPEIQARFALVMEMVGDNAEINRRLQEKADTDSTTGLLQRDAFALKYEASIRRLEERNGDEKNRVSALIFLDIDKTKELNDRFGHPTTDDVLTAIGKKIGQSIRATDVAGKFGGDEFMIMLNDLPKEEAIVVAQRILEAACSYVVTKNKTTGKREVVERSSYNEEQYGKIEATISLSAGIKLIEPEGAGRPTLQATKTEADQALYTTKHQGRGGLTLLVNEDSGLFFKLGRDGRFASEDPGKLVGIKKEEPSVAESLDVAKSIVNSALARTLDDVARSNNGTVPSEISEKIDELAKLIFQSTSR